MRPQSFIKFTCYGVVIVLSCLAGTWSAPLNTTRDELRFPALGRLLSRSTQKRAISATSGCAGADLQAVESSIDEAKDMVEFVVPRLAALLAILNSNPVPSTIGMSNADRTLFQTYEAFFGQAYFGTSTQANRQRNADAIVRLQQVNETASRIQQALRNPAALNLEIRCGDNFLVERHPSDTNKVTIPTPGLYFDERRWTPGSQDGMWVKTPGCRVDPTMTAFTYEYSDQNLPLGESVIVLCQGHLPGWRGLYDRAETVSAYHYLNYPLIQSQLDYLWGFLPTTLIHELTHTETILKHDTLGDQSLSDGTKAYQWQNIRKLAQENPALAPKNSDTFSLFVAAIYFNDNDWSTGTKQPLGFIPLVIS